MPGPKPLPIVVTEQQCDALQKLVARSTTEQRLVRRAWIILLTALGHGTRETASVLRISQDTVCYWKQRWREQEPHALATGNVPRRLADAPRPGGPPTFTAEQWCQIMALACEDPNESGRPISHWTIRELTQEAQDRQIVESISACHVGRFFKRSRSQTASDPLLADPTAGSPAGGAHPRSLPDL
jgi:putative transposase